MNTVDRWHRLWSVFHLVREAPADSRESVLAEAVAGDADLAREVRSLLQADGISRSPLDSAVRAIPSAGDRIGPYRLIAVRGEGGMGVVYEAEQSEPVRRRVALKMLRSAFTRPEEQIRFEAERQALALMTHPNIARVFDAGEFEGRPYFAMEFVDGTPLGDYCDRQRLTIAERVELFIVICAAIQHAHQRGVIHRDLKPLNVLVTTEDGKALPKIIDFGIAKAVGIRLTDRTVETISGTVLGTPDYMSPEQASLDATVDTRSDVYTLGLLLYELLSGVLPYERNEKGGLLSTLRAITSDDIPTPSKRVADLPASEAEAIAEKRRMTRSQLIGALQDELQWIVMRALEKNAEARYQSATELGSDLKRHLANEPVLAGPPSGTYRLRKLVRKHRTAFAAVAAVAVSLVLGIAGTGWMAVVASREQAAAESARDSARREAEVAKATTKFVRQMLMAPDPWKSFTASREIKVIEVLDKARDQLRDLEKQPEVAAHLRSTLGETYFQLGATEEAMPLLAESIRDHERLYGAEHPLTLTARHNHAEALDRNADYVAAEKEARAIYRLRERILGRDHVDTITSLAFAARMHMRQGRTKEAEPIFRDVLARSRRVLGPDHKVTLMVANELAECVKPLRGNAEALTLGRDVLERRARTLGPDHPDTVNTMNNLAGALFVRGETAEAVDMYRRVVDTYTRVLGADHPRTLTARNNLAVTLYGSKRHEETEVEMRYIAEAQARVRGPEHPNTLTAQNNLARIVLERGRANEALAMYNKLLPVATRVLPAHHWDLALYRFGYGLTLAKLGDFKRAQLEIENAHKDLLDKYGPNDSRTKNVAAKLALIREGKLPPELSASKRSL